MKRIALIFTGLIFITFYSSAQPVNCSFGLEQSISLERGDSYQKMVGADKTGFYVLRVDYQNDIWLEFWNGDNLIRETNNRLILPSVGGVQAEFKEMYCLDGKLIMFTTVTNESIKQKTLYMQEVNKSGKIMGNNKPIGRLTNQNIVVDFDISLTENGKNMFVHYQRPFQTYNEEPFFLKIYDSDMEEVLNKTIKLPLVDREFDIIQYRVMDEQIFMLSKKKPKEEGRRSRRGTQTFEYSILIYDIPLSKVQEYPVTVEKYIPQNAIFGVNEEEKFVDVMGFMAKKNKEEYSGIYHERLYLETKEWAPRDKKTTYHTFERNEERDFSAGHLYQLWDEIYNYKLRDIVYLSTGDPVMISEHVNRWKDSIVDPQTKEVTYNRYYKFNDILAGKIDRENNFEWIARIPKSQESYNDFGDYSSFSKTVIGEKIKFYYNDHRKNLKLLANDFYNPNDLKVIRNPEGRGRAITTTLFTDGKVYGAYMFGDDYKKKVIKPDLMTEHDGTYYIYAKRRNDISFARFYVE
ncbi:MAG: hypothetical protein U9Q98_05915 [Bacteroidota bacterium]|nr:hypothetical protein [Bacteroidota bacterium]